jgi:hypothetical protein
MRLDESSAKTMYPFNLCWRSMSYYEVCGVEGHFTTDGNVDVRSDRRATNFTVA